MKKQTLQLLKEWNGIAGGMLNASYVLQSDKATLLEEKFNGDYYSRVHRGTNGDLLIEEREKGSMYPKVWEFTQDFAELARELNNRKNKHTQS